ncbi:Dipeptidyl aminopeptidase/acylaminoacyl peptidase [Sphingomonas laterariae]|uniref:Dipeptidyl aminopeptidase/acylaminoacyl peptidase n=1 Tax=Edaphosphingomonas laterariae TaxID=861865 RepID=A0A239CDN1_9SPHN|nr:S9 family peptidase [Sphingomonas laterariae]SNS18356.1 Dipeptidyl aminopeptidase/acylaminoacyl peptidase [Sphingomonas laterariae]
MILRTMTALALALATPAVAAETTPATSVQNNNTPRPAEDFGRVPFLSEPSISPDGRRIAARIAMDGQMMLAVFPVLASEGKPVLLPIAGGAEFNWWRWVGNDWLAVGIGKTVSITGTDFYATRIVGVSADGKQAQQLAYRDVGEKADDLLWTARDGSARILFAMQRSIYLGEEFWPQVMEADLSTGRLKSAGRSATGVIDWHADGQGVVRIGIGYSKEGRNSRLLYRAKQGDLFRVVDRAKSARDENLMVPALFLADPGKAVAFDDSSGFTTLRELDLATLELGRTIFQTPGHDLAGIVPNIAGDSVLGVRTLEDQPRTHWLDAGLAEIQAALDKSVPGRVADIVSMDAEQRRLLVHVAAPNRPGAYYLFDRDIGRMQRFAFVNEAFGFAEGHPVKTIRFKARDGLEIPMIVTLPRNRPATNLPVIMMPHGGPFARDSESWDWWAQFLADRGYAVLQPNFRGSAGYGNAFAARGEGQWGLAMQDDLNDALAWAAKQGMVDAKRACIVGASYGGYAAMRAAQRDGALYRCAVSYAGVSDLTEMLRYNRRFLNSGAGSDWLREQAPDLRNVSPINFPADIAMPMLIMHGKEDQRVPVRQSREFAEKLAKAGKPARYVEQPLGDHHFSREEDRLQFLKELEAFLNQHNPPG